MLQLSQAFLRGIGNASRLKAHKTEHLAVCRLFYPQKQKTPEIQAAYIDVHYENSRMTGFEVAAKIKTIKGIDFPFVVMSTNDNQANQQNSKELGAVAFVDKHYESMKASTEYLREFLGNLHGPFPYKIFNLNDSFR